MQPAGGGTSQQSSSRMWRSSDGKMRFDTPKTSIISDPSAQHTIILDHVKKEASIFPMPPAAGGSAAPGMPQAPAGGAPAPPPVKVEDLGKATIEGHEVEGKRYTLPPMQPPSKPQIPSASAPSAPQAPGAPKPPQAPKMPQAPKLQAPKLPSATSVTEVWTSVKLKTPVLTKTSTSVGEQTTYCKPTSTDEPHPSLFQVPPEYKIKPPDLPKPKPPAAPSAKPPAVSAVALPKPPKIPALKPPKLPKLPAIKPPKV